MKYLVFSFAAVCVFALFFDLGLNVTPSLPKGIYISNDDLPQRGDIAKYCLDIQDFVTLAQERDYLGQNSSICPYGLRPLLKIVAGVAGDTVTVKNEKIYITHKQTTVSTVWPSARARDAQGRPLISVLEEGIIPQGKVLLLTTHAGGFDSRYFGFVDRASLQKFNPLLTF